MYIFKLHIWEWDERHTNINPYSQKPTYQTRKAKRKPTKSTHQPTPLIPSRNTIYTIPYTPTNIYNPLTTKMCYKLTTICMVCRTQKSSRVKCNENPHDDLLKCPGGFGARFVYLRPEERCEYCEEVAASKARQEGQAKTSKRYC